MRAFRDLHNNALYCRQAMKTAILCMQASGFRNVLPDLEVALAAILADPYRSELCDQLDSMAELLIDEGEIERAMVLLTATGSQRSREGSLSTSPALVRHQDILHRARREMSVEAYRDAQTNSVGLSIEAAFRTALILSVSETGRPPNT
jgi:hypothetical protein